MNPRVGPARALREYVFTGNASNSRGQSALDGRLVRLDLPTRKAGAIISQYQLDITHAEIESSGTNEHPRLHRLRLSRMERWGQGLSYTVAFPSAVEFC